MSTTLNKKKHPKTASKTERRSWNMAQIRSYGNLTTEEKLRKVLKNGGITGWRRHLKLLGRPDFVFRQKKLIIFVDGCFWHGCRKCYKLPKSNTEYWRKKVRRNMERDSFVTKALTEGGWKVLRIKECEIGTGVRVLKQIKKQLLKNWV